MPKIGGGRGNEASLLVGPDEVGMWLDLRLEVLFNSAEELSDLDFLVHIVRVGLGKAVNQRGSSKGNDLHSHILGSVRPLKHLGKGALSQFLHGSHRSTKTTMAASEEVRG